MNSQDELRKLVFSSGDRHQLSNFFDVVNSMNDNGLLDEGDYSLLRTGIMAKYIFDIKYAARRPMLPYELGDKLNYLTIIQDNQTLESCFLNDKIIQNLGELPSYHESNYWLNSLGSMPIEVRNKIGQKLIEMGYEEVAQKHFGQGVKKETYENLLADLDKKENYDDLLKDLDTTTSRDLTQEMHALACKTTYSDTDIEFVRGMLKSESEIKSMILSSGDRHQFSNFLYAVNGMMKQGILNEDDLQVIRSGNLANYILHLKEFAGRPLQPFEIGDKLNYLTLLNDTETLNAWFLNEDIINNIGEQSKSSECNYWLQSIGSMPIETRTKLAQELIKHGYSEQAMEMLEKINKDLEFQREWEKEKAQSQSSTLKVA